ncbi:MAG: hypothetical protein ABSH12_02335, partial [Endomicrobiales bacterium]
QLAKPVGHYCLFQLQSCNNGASPYGLMLFYKDNYFIPRFFRSTFLFDSVAVVTGAASRVYDVQRPMP